MEPFNIPQITAKDILEYINKLPTNKSTGHDGLSARVLKLIAPALKTPLVKMMNISIDSSVFPSVWKTALVAPLHKDGPRDDVNNYRPIAVLPVLSKILERHVTKSLTNYLNENNLIFTYQSAFRENHSTETALIQLTDNLLFNMDNEKVTGMISIDFKKAFDLVNHEILLQKLQMYGLSDSAVKWFHSYLSDRQQCVKVNECTSSLLPINQGIPQGTIVGPMLFLIFINDAPLYVQNSNMNIYADDATLISSSRWDNITPMNDNIQKDLESIQQWALMNKMIINEKKTKSMLIKGKRLRKRMEKQHLAQNSSVDQLSIILNNSPIENVHSHKILGIEVDEDLDFTNHCEILARKISKRIGLLKHISPYLRRNQREIYYKAVIKPVILYGANIWTSTSKGSINSIFKLQKRAARIILDAEPRSRSVSLFNLLNRIPFYHESYAIRCSLLLKRILGMTPVYLKQMLKLNSDTHNRSTRFSNLNFNCPRYKNETEGGRTFTVRSIKEWNNLDKDLKELKSAKALKKKVINNLLSKQNSNMNFL